MFLLSLKKSITTLTIHTHRFLPPSISNVYSYKNQIKTKSFFSSLIFKHFFQGGGNLVQTLRRSYSLSDLSEPDITRTEDEIDEIVRPNHQRMSLRPRTQSTRSASTGSGSVTAPIRTSNVDMYFQEVDVGKTSTGHHHRSGTTPIIGSHSTGTSGSVGIDYNYIRSSEDISSGYSSAEPLSTGLSRTASLTNTRARSVRGKKSEVRYE